MYVVGKYNLFVWALETGRKQGSAEHFSSVCIKFISLFYLYILLLFCNVVKDHYNAKIWLYLLKATEKLITLYADQKLNLHSGRYWCHKLEDWTSKVINTAC